MQLPHLPSSAAEPLGQTPAAPSPPENTVSQVMSSSTTASAVPTEHSEGSRALDAVPSLGPVSRVVALEEFCGSAGLAAQLRLLGIDALGLDYSRNPQRPLAPIINCDMSLPSGQKTVYDICENANVEYTHAAPPCGTATRARDRPLPAAVRRRLNIGSPARLRSDEMPYGLPGLTGLNAIKVKAANATYLFVAAFCTMMWAAGKMFSIENPRSSYFWLLEETIAVMNLEGVKCYDFQQCMHGGTRPVWRRWCSNVPQLSVLCLQCDGKHVHDKFHVSKSVDGTVKFSTADEATYPLILCQRVSQCILENLLLKGYTKMPATMEEADSEPMAKRLRLRATVGLLVKGNRLPQVISEFEHIRPLPACKSKVVGTKFTVLIDDVSVEAKVLRFERGSDGQDVAVCGLYRSPESFVKAAEALVHPLDMPSTVSDEMLNNIFWTLTTTPAEIKKFREWELAKMRIRARILEDQEKALHSGMPEAVQKVFFPQTPSPRGVLCEFGGRGET